MDPSRYYGQAGPSSQYPPHQPQGNDRTNHMQVAPLDNQAVQQYIQDLYRDPTRVKLGPTTDPAFYAKAQQDLLGAKHRLEQMLLVNQQHAEIAQMSTQIPRAPPSHPPHATYMNVPGIPYPHGAWAGSAPGPWTYQQPVYQPQPAFQQPVYPPHAYAQPVAHAYGGHHVPDATMYDATYQQAQSVPQVVQLDSPQLYSAPSHPSRSPQPQTGSTSQNPGSTQQRTVPLPSAGVPSESQSAPSAPTSLTQNVHQPQPQSQSQQPTKPPSNPLQPGHQPNQTSPSATQKDREAAQKQLQYLQVLAQQHQRTQQTQPSSHKSSPAPSQLALPSVPPIPNVGDSVLLQPVPQPGFTQRSSSPEQEMPAPIARVQIVEAVTPSPAKIRSRKPFALHDLRSERRQSTAPSNASSTPSREINLPDNQGISPSMAEMPTPTRGANAMDNVNHGSIVAEPSLPPRPSTPAAALSPNPSNMFSVLPETVQAATESPPVLAGTTSLASEIPNASTPALNNPTQPASVSPPSTNAHKQPGAGGSKMKIALENLHARGVDCVALVRQAAQIAKVSVNNLSESNSVDASIPLFAPGQPLDVWTSNLQVTRNQGDAVVKSIWDLMKKKAREIGIDTDVLKYPSSETTNETPVEKHPVAKYGNSIPPVDSLPVTSSSNDSAAHGASQHVTAPQQPQATPSVVNLSMEPRPQSTQLPMQTPVVPPPAVLAPAPVPARPASTPVASREVAQPVPTLQTPTAPPAQLGAGVWQTLGQQYQHNLYPNGAHTPQPAYRVPGQQPQPQPYAPAYVPPNLGAHTQMPVQSQAPVRISQPQPQPHPQPQPQQVKAKPRKTAALDYLRALGVLTVETESAKVPDTPSKPVVVESAPIQTKDKGKGKATDVEEPATPAQPEPGNSGNGDVAPEPAPPINVAGPSQVLEVPPSPVAPTIAVLPEPSPTPPSPLSTAEDITRPMTPIAQSPVVTHAPTLLQPSIPTIESLDAPALAQPSAPGPVTVEDSPEALPITTSNADPAPLATPQTSGILSPPIASISTLTLNNQSSPAESTALKRKRESRPPDVIEAGPGPNTEERARQHTVNKHDQKRPKVTKRDSTTTGAGKQPPHPESPYPNIPRPDSPLPKNSWAQSYATAMNLVSRSERPLFRPETPPSSPSKSSKRKLIMEVVIPLRKKGKVTAEPSSSMIDLTSDTGTERDDDLGLGELVGDIYDDARTEQEPDLKMLRRRLRPHMCEWTGCIGPAVLSSVELLGVHMNRHHLNCRDPETGYYMCRWGNCMLHFKNPRRLWSHISDKHVRHPLYCPYQGCDRTTSERYRMIVHVNRAHRGNPDAELRVFAQPEDFPPDRDDPEEGLVLRPDAFPDGVPYFRIMGMALRYEIVPAQIPSHRHARIGPIILRNISAPTGLVSVPRQTNNRAPELPLLASPMAARPQVRLGTTQPDALGEELEREAGPPPNKSPVRRIPTVKGAQVAESNGKARANPSPARSHITITSNESSPEPKTRRVSAIHGQGSGRRRGDLGLGDRSMMTQSSQSSAPRTPRYKLVVELPSRGRGGSSSPRK